MTYRDRFKAERDGANPPTHLCPQACGYEPDSYACDEMESCRECWGREIPKEEEQ